VKFVSFLAQSFFSIPLQDFSEKVSTAIGIAEAINRTDGDISTFSEKDLKRLKYIMEHTNEKYGIPLAELDLYVDPTKGSDITRYEHPIKIKSHLVKDEVSEDYKEFKLKRYTIQKILFDAVTETLSIVNSYFLKYNDEIDFSSNDNEESKVKLDFGKD